MTAAWENVVTALVAQRGDALLRYAWLISGNPQDAADLVQNALVKTFGRLGTGFTIGGAEAYVRHAILTGYLDDGRRRTRWHRIAHLAVAPQEQESPATAAESRIDMGEALKTLSKRQRACLVLRYYEDLKVDDIAAELSISSGAVKRYLSDGLAALAAGLAEPITDATLVTPGLEDTAPTETASTDRLASGPAARGGSHAQ